jgi:hypothetical protein
LQSKINSAIFIYVNEIKKEVNEMTKEIMALNAELNLLRGGESAANFFTTDKAVIAAMDAVYDKIAKIQRAEDVALMNEAERFGLMNQPTSGWQNLNDSDRATIRAMVEDRRANNAPTNDDVLDMED